MQFFWKPIRAIRFSVKYDLCLQDRSFDFEILFEIELLLEVELLFDLELLLEVELPLEVNLEFNLSFKSDIKIALRMMIQTTWIRSECRINEFQTC